MAENKPMGGGGHGGPGGRGPIGMKPKLETSMKEILKKIFSIVLKKYSFHLIVVLFCIIGAALANVQGTLFTKTLIDNYITPLIGSSNPDFSSLIGALLRVAIFYLIGVVCSFIQSWIMIYVSQGTLKTMRKKVFDHMQTLPIKYFDTNAHGDIMSVYTNDVDTLRQLIGHSLPQVFSAAITIITTVVSMIVLNLPLTLLSFVMIFVMFKSAKYITKKSGFYFKKQQACLGKTNGYIEELISGQKVVKVFCHEQKTIDEFNKINNDLQKSSENANKFANILMPVNGQIGNLSYVLCAVLGAIFILTGFGGVTVGTLVAFLQLSKSVTMPISQVSMQMNSIVMAMAGAERIFKLLDQKPEADDGYVTLVNAKIDENGNLSETDQRTGVWAWKHYHKSDNTTTFTKLQGHIVMNEVDFGYTDDKNVLFDVTLDAHPGEKIAFVGSTGAGKTTITNLINRFYDIQDGKIRYDGININKIKKDDLRRSLGMVLQDTHLFTDTIMENIRYGRLDATDEECIEAAKLANADSFITRLSDGYSTVLKGDGGNLSQGQRQLLAIARAAVANPPTLILDEATSSIDTRTESLVQNGMDKLMKGRTTFVIAHRLSTVKNSDCITVLELGRIIEQGSHDELIEKKGKYYQLYTGNFADNR